MKVKPYQNLEKQYKDHIIQPNDNLKERYGIGETLYFVNLDFFTRNINEMIKELTVEGYDRFGKLIFKPEYPNAVKYDTYNGGYNCALFRKNEYEKAVSLSKEFICEKALIRAGYYDLQ